MKTKTTFDRAAVDTVATPALYAGKRSRVVGLLLALATLVAVCSGALANPNVASAHNTDALHRHGWSFGPSAECVYNSRYFSNVLDQINMNLPDVVTSPWGADGRNAKVYFTAELQYRWGGAWYNFNPRWYLPSWYYTLANPQGMAIQWWYENGTNRYAPNRVGFEVVSGYTYRIKVWYYWGVDGKWHSDVTSSCSF